MRTHGQTRVAQHLLLEAGRGANYANYLHHKSSPRQRPKQLAIWRRGTTLSICEYASISTSFTLSDLLTLLLSACDTLRFPINARRWLNAERTSGVLVYNNCSPRYALPLSFSDENGVKNRKGEQRRRVARNTNTNTYEQIACRAQSSSTKIHVPRRPLLHHIVCLQSSTSTSPREQ